MIRSGTYATELGLFKDDLMGSQADSSSRGTGQKGTVWVANMGTQDQSKRPVSGVLGHAEKPLPRDKWQVPFIVHWCVGCSGRTLGRGLQHYLGILSHGLVTQAKEGTKHRNDNSGHVRFHPNTQKRI